MPKDEDVFPLADYLDSLVEDLREHVPDAVKKFDSDAIHDARVSTRRLKAALDLCKPILSGQHRKPFGKLLRLLRQRLGPMRDLDVMIEHLESLKEPRHQEAVKWMMEQLERQRKEARDDASAKTTPAKWLTQLGMWWGVRYELIESKRAVDTLLAESLHLQIDSFSEQADRLCRTRESDAGPQDPHELRISGKALRYTLEMADKQEHAPGDAVRRAFKKMQDSLGIWHDYVVLTECIMSVSLQTLLAHHDAQMQGKLLELAKLTLRRAEQQLALFRKQWMGKGTALADEIRQSFPLTRPVSQPVSDADQPAEQQDANATAFEN